MIKVTFSGWPNQYVNPHWAINADKTVGEKYGWNPFKVKGMGRFGGGWGLKFGIATSRDLTDWVIDLGLGSVRVTKTTKRGVV